MARLSVHNHWAIVRLVLKRDASVSIHRKFGLAYIGCDGEDVDDFYSIAWEAGSDVVRILNRRKIRLHPRG